MNKRNDQGDEGLGRELEGLLASVPPPKAPAWFAAKTLVRLRAEKAERRGGWLRIPQWKWLAAGLGMVVLVFGVMRWNHPTDGISDAEVFAALNSLVQEDEDRRWWAGL